ncbi:predicted protein [Plenodomus lingam JN3]|uniref:Predicted protein n=1 Tax=Leptosphaeria maculans (strain JN3 / isolate v23.1.3 / race Av1-4-5-6-7-8) TaxID=985895 RepID=E5A1P6_LEPMJ|nr:predicted protein [Plenodomus lingam JN3]CBX97613.1 predicted protein [Plenodomus lingam JN3]
MAGVPRLSVWLSATEGPSCDHDYVPMFVTAYRVTEALKCAPWMINHCIRDIHSVQAGLQGRGCIFSSKYHGQHDRLDDSPQHRGWTNKWRLHKIYCCNFIRALEQMTYENTGRSSKLWDARGAEALERGEGRVLSNARLPMPR